MKLSNELNVSLTFPEGFLWGTATASHQVEGGNHNSWTVWEDRSAAEGQGASSRTHVSGRACDWWNGRAEDDFARAASMQNNALRLSVEWSRIEPEPGRWDESALERYRAMLVALRAQGLEPVVTLHHFTNPIWLEERGAWLNPETPALFGRYAAKVAAALGDHVRLWCTINEPVVYGRARLPDRQMAPRPPRPGRGPDRDRPPVEGPRRRLPRHQARPSRRPDRLRQAPDSLRPGRTARLGHLGAGLLNHLFNEMIFGPFNTGRMRILPGKSVSIPQANRDAGLDRAAILQPPPGALQSSAAGPVLFEQYARPDQPHGPRDWGELAPEESYPIIRQLYRLTKRPIYITEMGVPDADDSIRPGYLTRTLRSVWEACMHSYPVRGFFFWSLVDNFEWAEGYDPRYRFGLYGVDFQTQERTERRSARLYRAVAGANALTAAIVREHAPEVFDRVFPAPEMV